MDWLSIISAITATFRVLVVRVSIDVVLTQHTSSLRHVVTTSNVDIGGSEMETAAPQGTAAPRYFSSSRSCSYFCTFSRVSASVT